MNKTFCCNYNIEPENLSSFMNFCNKTKKTEVDQERICSCFLFLQSLLFIHPVLSILICSVDVVLCCCQSISTGTSASPSSALSSLALFLVFLLSVCLTLAAIANADSQYSYLWRIFIANKNNKNWFFLHYNGVNNSWTTEAIWRLFRTTWWRINVTYPWQHLDV